MNIKKSYKSKGLYFCLKEATKYLFPIRWISDKKTMDSIYQKKAYRYLKRKYIPYLNDFRPELPESTEPPRIIWTAWLQGEDKAPELVRKCIASMREHAAGYDVRVVTNENLGSYITIPDFIDRRLQKHQMQYAQYSDYLRTALLVEYGGIWMDSTVLMTGNLPEIAVQSPLFFFKSSPDDNGVIKCSSWFIAAQTRNPILQQAQYLLECYWKKEHKLCDYFLFHLLLSNISESSPSNVALWKSIPFRNNCDVHRMQGTLFEPYTESLYKDTCSISAIHKLSYKFPNSDMTARNGTIYGYILNS